MNMMDQFVEDSEAGEPRPRPKEVKVAHKSEVAKLVYEIIGKNAPPLMYVEANRFATWALGEGWQWFAIEAKLKDALNWVKAKGANHSALHTVLTKIKNTK